jgi:DNA transformation protein and related proteins
MPVSASYKAYVLEQVQVTGPVVVRAMFGGVGLYSDGFFFGLIDDDTLYLKVDDSTRADFEAAGAKPFQPYGEGSYSMRYYEVPADVLEDRTMVGQWVRKAVAVARRSATARKRPRSS